MQSLAVKATKQNEMSDKYYFLLGGGSMPPSIEPSKHQQTCD